MSSTIKRNKTVGHMISRGKLATHLPGNTPPECVLSLAVLGYKYITCYTHLTDMQHFYKYARA